MISLFMYTLLIYGFDLDMKKEGKRPIGRSPGEGKDMRGNAGSQQGAR